METKVEGPRNLGFVLSEANGSLSYETVTIASGAGNLQPGTVLGKITTGGKYIPSPAALVEGSEGAETAVAVLGYGVDATSSDAKAVILARHAEVKRDKLIFAASVNDAGKITAKHTQLAALDIRVR